MNAGKMWRLRFNNRCTANRAISKARWHFRGISIMSIQAIRTEENLITEEPYYEPVGDEVEVFAAAYRNQLPVLLKGPTGCGKTRFIEYMSWYLKRPMITVACHDDLTAADLIDRRRSDRSLSGQGRRDHLGGWPLDPRCPQRLYLLPR